MFNFRLPALIVVFLFLFINNGYSSDEFSGNNIVAKYDNKYLVTVDELNQYIKDWLYYKKFRDRADIYRNALNDLLVNQFKRMDFFEKGLDKNEKLIQDINRIINEELVSEYFETQYLGKYANEEYAKKEYETLDKEVVYRLIELSKPLEATQQQLDSLKELAFVIKSQVDNGKDFGDLVKEYSQNKISLMNNGYMPPVDWIQNYSDPISNAIFNLDKNEVRVLNSTNTFMIVKITDVNKVKLEPFDSLKTKIITELQKAYATTSADEYEEDVQKLIDEDKLKWNSEGLEQIVQWSNLPDFYQMEYRQIIKNALEKGENKTILTYDNSVIDYSEFLRLLDNILLMGKSMDVKEDDIKKFFLEALRTDLIVKKADSLGLKKNIFNSLTTNPAIKNQVAFLYNQVEIEAKIPEASIEALNEFFRENEDTLYYQLEKRNIFLMVFPTKIEAENVLAKINSGTQFEKVTGSYLVKTYIKDRDGEIKSYQKSEKPVFSKIAFEMQESEISDVVTFEDEDGQTKFAVIKCYHIRPEKQLTFDEVENTITEDFKNYQREIIAKKVEEKLKNRYKPVINEELLANLISSK